MGIKKRNFMLISKIQTYVSDKMHQKKLFQKNMLNLNFYQA
jgi:hypothetical protein